MKYAMDMARNKKMVTLTLPHELVERLERWINSQRYPPAKNAVIEEALTEFLDREDKRDGKG